MKKVLIALAVGYAIAPSVSSASAEHGWIGDGTFTYLGSENKNKSVRCNKNKFDAYISVDYRLNKWRKARYHSSMNTLYSVDNVKVKEYVIYRYGGQKGGNKANINLTYLGREAKSADNIRQDGKVHSLGLTTGYGSNPFWRNQINSRLSPTIEVIFDKSGPDPKCKVTVPLV